MCAPTHTAKTKYIQSLAATLLLATFAIGCKSTPEVHHYQLNVTEHQADISASLNATQTQALVLGVEPLKAESSYDDIRMVYRKSPYRIDYYHYHRWSAPPSIMLTDQLRAALSNTGKFKRVTGGYGRDVDIVLKGRVVALEEVDTSEDAWQARLVLELELEDMRTGDVLWSETLQQVKDVETLNPEGVTIAASQALGDIIVTLVPKISAAASARRPSQTAIEADPSMQEF